MEELGSSGRWRCVARHAVLAAALALSSLVNNAQPITLVKDINTLPATSLPKEFTQVGGIVFFVASDFDHGQELWRTDGMVGGTSLVKDVYPGPTGSLTGNLVNVNGTLFFSATDGSSGRELWKSDGTAGGTVMVKDINPGPEDSVPFALSNVSGTLFFAADEGVSGHEVWKSDGTDTGTVLVKDINPGAAGSDLRRPTNVNGTFFFTANDGSTGQELWKSDGTSAGTVLVKDIVEGSSGAFSNGSDFTELAHLNGILFFSAASRLWGSDGTEAGTVRLMDAASGTPSSVREVTAFGTEVFFTATDKALGLELWKSDGTITGTLLVKDIQTGAEGSNPEQLTVSNQTLFFAADNGLNGAELWKSDGTAGGTVLVDDIRPGSAGSLEFFSAGEFTDVSGTLFFIADDGITGRELWSSDGTSLGTDLVRDILPGADHSFGEAFNQLASIGGLLYFVAIDSAAGREPHRSDGTETGTVLVKDIRAETDDSNPEMLTLVGSDVFFVAGRFNDRELWKSDTTLAGTARVADLRPDSGDFITELANAGGTLFLSATDEINGQELWKSDGTESGTTLVKDIWPGAGSSSAYWLTPVNGTLFFGACDDVSGCELWKSDGTEVGTDLVKDIQSGVAGAVPRQLTEMNGVLFFSANDGAGHQLWKSDGTEGGTVLVRTFGGATAPISFLTPVNGTLFLSAFSSSVGCALWKSDGTAQGTVLVKQIGPEITGRGPAQLTNVSGTLFFTDDDGVNGQELWKSDGTEAGTVMVKDIRPGPEGSFLDFPFRPELVEFNGSLFMAADDGTNGVELWTSDGTEAGTVLVKDIQPGPGSSTPTNFATTSGTLFFGADDGLVGIEPWMSDGTPGGTIPIADVGMGVGNSSPSSFTVLGSQLLFAAADGFVGRELWAADINLPPVADAGPAQTLDIALGSTAQVTLDGSGSFDPDGDALTFTWTGPFGEVAGEMPTVELGLGIHVITLVVEDPSPRTDSDTVTITVEPLGATLGGIQMGGSSLTWIADTNGDGELTPGVDTSYDFGQPGDFPVIGDWLNTGSDHPGVVRPNGNQLEWRLLTPAAPLAPAGSPQLAEIVHTFGSFPLDLPVVGRWTAGGADRIGVVRPNGGQLEWRLDASGDGVFGPGDLTLLFGTEGAHSPLPGDWDGDSDDNLGVVGVNGNQIEWRLDDGDGLMNAGDAVHLFGVKDLDLPIRGDWNGDGADEIGTVRPNGDQLEYRLDFNGDGQFLPGDDLTVFTDAGASPISGMF